MTHRTVQELLTGRPAPLSSSELRMWGTYYKVKKYYQETQKDS
jgi:hypothetical protein